MIHLRFIALPFVVPFMLLAGCGALGPERVPPSAVPQSPATATEAAIAPAPAETIARAAPRPSAASSLEAYKIDIAQQIHRASSDQLYEGSPPPMLKSVVVLQISIDRDGQPFDVKLLRSNGFKALEQRAIQSVSRGAPYPKPASQVLRGQRHVALIETWLFRDDGKFQVRTLAGPQQSAP